MTLNELLGIMSDDTQIRVILRKHEDDPINIIGSAKVVYESYNLHIDKHVVTLAYVEEGVLIIEAQKED